MTPADDISLPGGRRLLACNFLRYTWKFARLGAPAWCWEVVQR